MVKVSVLNPNGAGTKFDMNYYLDQHIPMVRRLLGSVLKGVSVEHGISGEGPKSPAPYIATGHLLFDSLQAFHHSFCKENSQPSFGGPVAIWSSLTCEDNFIATIRCDNSRFGY